jgi:hypothetical protein
MESDPDMDGESEPAEATGYSTLAPDSYSTVVVADCNCKVCNNILVGGKSNIAAHRSIRVGSIGNVSVPGSKISNRTVADDLADRSADMVPDSKEHQQKLLAKWKQK